jgi:hypothetical protein
MSLIGQARTTRPVHLRTLTTTLDHRTPTGDGVVLGARAA